MSFTVILLALLAVTAVTIGVVSAFSTSTGQTVFSKHDELYQLPPGALPPAGGVPVRKATAADVAAPVAVRVEPPEGVLPEQVGMLTTASVQSSDVAAAFIGLAVDGFLHLSQVDREVGLFRKRLEKHWLITVKRPDDGSLPALRAQLLSHLIGLGGPVEMHMLKLTIAEPLRQWRNEHAATPQHHAWYPHLVDGRFPLGARLTTPGAKQRTALGSALRYQSAGFKLFLETADAERLRFEEGAGIFSRYLPWAVAYGVTEHWVQVFREAAALADPSTTAGWASDLAWYGDFGTFDASFDALGDGLGDMMGSLDAALDDLTSSLDDLASDFSDVGDAGSDSGGDGGGDGGGGGD